MKRTKQFVGQSILIVLLAVCVLCFGVFAQTTACFAAEETSKARSSIGAKEAPAVEDAKIGDQTVEITVTAYDAHKTDATNNALSNALTEFKTKGKAEICKALNDEAKKIDKSYNAEIYEVTDIFDVSATNVTVNNDNKLVVTLATSIATGAKANEIVALNCANGVWTIAPVAIKEGGKIEVTLSALGPVALLKVTEENVAYVKAHPVDESCCKCCGENCPFCKWLCTGTACFCWVVYVAIALLVVLIILAILVGVKKSKEKKLAAEEKIAKETLDFEEEKPEEETETPVETEKPEEKK